MNQLSPHVLDDLSDLVGAALECPVRLMAQPGVPGETQFHVYDDQAHRVAVVRWADDPARQRQIDRLAQLILGWWRSDPQGVEHGAVFQG